LLAFLLSAASRHAAASGSLVPNARPTTQTDIPGPAGSGQFGGTVTVLPNGNFVVVDTTFSEGGVSSIGAVYLYDGATLTVISTLK